MRFIAVATLLAFSAVYSSAGQNVDRFVVNGEDALIQDHPYMAKVWNLNYPTCGGAILSPRNVLTAAHCLDAVVSRPLLVSVVVGSSYRNGDGGLRFPALRLIVHPQYARGPIYDVAIIRTVARIIYSDTIQPIALAGSQYIGEGVEGVFTGWGFIAFGLIPRRAHQLQKMYIRTISNEVCREMYSWSHMVEQVIEQKLCVLSGPRTSVCGGDSGSPLVISGALAGVTSWRTMPCGDGMPDVFTRISTVRDWILSHV